MTWTNVFTGGFIIFLGIYFSVLFHYLSNTKIGSVDDRTDI